MSAEKSVISGREINVAKKAAEVLALILAGKRAGAEDLLVGLDKALQNTIDGTPFDVRGLKPRTFAELLVMQNPTQGIFNQLASETEWWQLLDQIEGACFFQPDNLVKAKPFISGLWEDEVVKQELFKPPAGWRYLPVEEAVEAFKKIFGSDIKASSVAERAKNLQPWDKAEGVAVWPSLSFLLRYFEIPKVLGISGEVNPWEDTEDGRAAYAKIADLFISEVSKACNKVFPFRNWRDGALTAGHILLTPAGQRAWQELESRSDSDDFVVAPANSGSLYAGYSVRRSRLMIVRAGNQFGQDCIMAGCIPMVQPGRLTNYKGLGIDCPGNSYSPGADGRFSVSLCFDWLDGKLLFDYRWADDAFHYFGSAGGRLG